MTRDVSQGRKSHSPHARVQEPAIIAHQSAMASYPQQTIDMSYPTIAEESFSQQAAPKSNYQQ